jgi:hypothetical protein
MQGSYHNLNGLITRANLRYAGSRHPIHVKYPDTEDSSRRAGIDDPFVSVAGLRLVNEVVATHARSANLPYNLIQYVVGGPLAVPVPRSISRDGSKDNTGTSWRPGKIRRAFRVQHPSARGRIPFARP